MQPSDPHDHFFKAVFLDKETAKALITDTFPKELARNIDLRTLKPENTSYIDEDLNEYFADLVYSCVYGKKTRIRISLLLEHKSKKEPYPHIQLLRYLLKVWEQDLKKKRTPLPVIPVIIYHGEGEWKYTTLRGLFQGHR